MQNFARKEGGRLYVDRHPNGWTVDLTDAPTAAEIFKDAGLPLIMPLPFTPAASFDQVRADLADRYPTLEVIEGPRPTVKA